MEYISHHMESRILELSKSYSAIPYLFFYRHCDVPIWMI